MVQWFKTPHCGCGNLGSIPSGPSSLIFTYRFFLKNVWLLCNFTNPFTHVVHKQMCCVGFVVRKVYLWFVGGLLGGGRGGGTVSSMLGWIWRLFGLVA